jgi:hypothetical protein
MTKTKPLNVVLLYKRDAQPETDLVRLIENHLMSNGHSVFIDRHLTMGMEWAREIEMRVRSADAIIALLSVESIHSEMLGFEIEAAHESSQLQRGRPRLLPVRIHYTGPLPEPLASILDPIQYFLWEGVQDNLGLLTELVAALEQQPQFDGSPEASLPRETRLVPRPAIQPRPKLPASATRASSLEPIGGAVPLDSPLYLERPVDGELRKAIGHRDSTVLIKGARQMGKTSLLARGLQHAREQGARVVSTDFQKFNADNFRSVNLLYLTLAESVADQLGLDINPAAIWDERRGPNANFERFVRREILARLDTPLVWGMDEVDRLFVTPFGSEVFGLFRSWHNERALDPAGPWSKLTLVIAYATEAHLFITDMNRSPFNVGTRLEMEDFTPVQVTEMNQRYATAVKSADDLNRFYRLVGGQPYLVRRGLQELSHRRMSFDTFEELGPREEGIYGDHLRRILVLLAQDPKLSDVMRGVLGGQPCPSQESFYRLRSAGLVIGHAAEEARPRCRLYSMYLRRHLS